MTKISRYCKWFFAALSFPVVAVAQSPSTVKEYKKSMVTYPFSLPSPVADTTSLYPYFRFDGFTDKPEKQQWKVVELENDFIKVQIMPEIGGKIWTAIDKKNNKPFIYNNDAVKFRDIALRGPWTSGGIEANFGIFGHTPGVSTPVDYITRQDADGSAVCTIGLLDLLTQTRWSMEIILPEDKAYFITKVLWHNGSGLDQPYYSWMNLGEKVADSLEYIDPGNHYLGHDGSLHSWPYDEETQKHIAVYAQNDFGSYKSYHVTGVYSTYFGAFWQKENYGMIHYAKRADKIGKKVWIWGLAPQGMIWEKLLTDHSGQYTELQSGRLFNQNAPESVHSPFKQISFSPYNTDTWSEYWYPFQHTNGVAVADLNSVINLQQKGNTATVFVSPVSYIKDTLKVWNRQGELLFNKAVSLQPLQSFQQDIPLTNGSAISKVTLAGTVLNIQDSAAKTMDRPLEPFKPFDQTSAYGLYVQGHYDAAQRHYAKAEISIAASLQKEPGFLPALVEMSMLQYRKMQYDSAWYYARQALSIDTYSPEANYYYALTALKLGKLHDAEDGFQVAAITPQYRTAAYTALSKMHLAAQNYQQAFDEAGNALDFNTKNITALQLQCVAARLMHKNATLDSLQNVILQLDPLNHFVRFEKYWQNKNEATKKAFTGLIRDELPQQTYLQMASWYYQLNMVAECKALLELAPQEDDEILYWLAWLHREDTDAKQWLAKAENGSPAFVFPFRTESAVVMQWAMQNTKDWKPAYYLALINAAHNQKREALQLLENIKTPVNFAPLYITRAQLRDAANTTAKLSDYRAAVAADASDWRYLKYLTQYLLSQQKNAEALHTIQPYCLAHPENYITGLLYIRCLIQNNLYADAEKLLNKIDILPFEGATDGHIYYEQTKLMLALQLWQNNKNKAALQKIQEARLWPENLGVGAPYAADIKNDLEDALEQRIKSGNRPATGEIDTFTKEITSLGAKK